MRRSESLQARYIAENGRLTTPARSKGPTLHLLSRDTAGAETQPSRLEVADRATSPALAWAAPLQACSSRIRKYMWDLLLHFRGTHYCQAIPLYLPACLLRAYLRVLAAPAAAIIMGRAVSSSSLKDVSPPPANIHSSKKTKVEYDVTQVLPVRFHG